MNRLIAPLGILLFIIASFGSCKSARKILTDASALTDSLPDSNPRFPGGADSLQAYLQRGVTTDTVLLQTAGEGTVLCAFWVDVDGRVDSPTVLRGQNAKLDSMAIDLLRAMPRWTPAVREGKYTPYRCAAAVRIGVSERPQGAPQTLSAPPKRTDSVP